MPIPAQNNSKIKGLTDAEVEASRTQYGRNVLSSKKDNSFLLAIKNILKEPMIILLLVASCIYFISGEMGDGIFLASAIILVAIISLHQDSRSRNAIEKLKIFSQPHCKVIRNGITEELKSEDLVVGDHLILEEGTFITADGCIIHSNDFSVNESILTGEAFSVFKDKTKKDKTVYSGTYVNSGLAIVKITNIGNDTKLGKIGKSLESISEEKTPLETQISAFVKKMVFAGTIIFIIVWVINYYQSFNLLDSLLKALTLAMSILPEEIPVAFTTFMALGAWRLMKLGIVVKQLKTVETLGSATVICIDKTGTITENKMSLAEIYVPSSGKIKDLKDGILTNDEENLITLSMWASEPIPFDPMEIALHRAYSDLKRIDERHNYKIIQEYPLSGKPPMMTHVFQNNKGKTVIASKGAPEAFFGISNLSQLEKEKFENIVQKFAHEGYRVLGVAESIFEGPDFPHKQQDFKFELKGLIAFYDPPKKNIPEVIESFYKAGISVKIITGDNNETTTSIAKQIGFKGYDKCISGEELMQLNVSELEECVMQTNIFTRMFPEAKLKIVNALKSKNQVVAMTGDGVNDGPALKAAHIGIAMGEKGTEIAKQAASLILLEDDLSKMVDAIAMGRRIYKNLKKAIQYIISIHIPIILTVFIPLALGWIYPNIFSPIHIIFLELIMGPTCSILFENEPMEVNTMSQNPRPLSTTFFSFRELTTSIIQGLMVTLGTLFTYQYAIQNDYEETITRTMVFTVLIAANIFLTLVNRSFYYTILTTIKYKNNLVLLIISITVTIVGLLLFVKPLTHFFEFEQLTFDQILLCIGIGFTSVIWFELVKIFKIRTQ